MYSEHLESLGYTNPDENSVIEDILALLSTLPESTQRKTLDAVYIVMEGAEVPNGTWVPFILGEHRVGSYARIKATGYTGSAEWHLGKVGTIVGIRSGRVLVQYIGRRNDGTGHYHSPDMVEVLVASA